jgi:hypothetical protein
MITKNSVSLAGEFAVLSQLALRGYDANMTLGNTKSVDILVSEPNTGKMFQLEVKTNFVNLTEKPSSSKLFGQTVSVWMMQKKHETISSENLFYCFVNIGKQTSAFRFFIVPSAKVATYVKAEHKLWLNQNKEHKDSEMRTFRIGLKEEKYRIFTPSSQDYENNWEFNI